MTESEEIKIEAAVGFSRKWDAREAGREVANTALKSLERSPDFFLLFSTIHYKTHDSFQEFLNGVWDVLPSQTPLIGGTIGSFINNHGCFSRGAVALAVSYPNMDITTGYGLGVKKNPKKVAEKCAGIIDNKLRVSSHKNKFLINMISGPIVPEMPRMGRVNVVKSRVLGEMIVRTGIKMFSRLGYGHGKEEELIDELAPLLQDYHIIGGSTMDDYRYLESYQFINKDIYTNSMVAIGGAVNLPIFLKSVVALHETERTFEITGMTSNNRVITEINGESAKKQFLEILGLSEGQLKNLGAFYYKTSNYFPITFEENREYTSGIGAIYGNNLGLGYMARGRKVRLLSITGKEIIDVVDDVFYKFSKNFFPFMFFVSSSIIMNILGNKVYDLKRKLDDYFAETPYLMICPLSENIGIPNKISVARVYSFNAMSFELNKHKQKNHINSD